MELKSKDTYRVQCSEFLSMDMVTSLFSLYQPVIGNDAAALYMTLYSENRMTRRQETHNHLSSLMNLSIDDIERARIHLEEYMLLRCYMQEGETANSYLYVLQAPMNRSNFFASRELVNLYGRFMGQKQIDTMLAKVQNEQSTTAGYKDVTRIVTHSSTREYDNEVVYSKVSPTYKFDADDTSINFDYDHFFRTTSTLVFPAELRTQENLKLIGKLATVYGISADRMRVLVSRCTDVENMLFDAERLKVAAAKTAPDITEASDPYSLPPVSFLQAKQNGAAVSVAEKRMLEDLSVKMHFAPEVINVMIEYILKVSQNRLVRSFVEMVAGEWARDGVTTKEQAIAQTKKKTGTPSSGNSRPRRQNVLPAYMKNIEEEVRQSGEELSQEELDKLQALMRRIGE